MRSFKPLKVAKAMGPCTCKITQYDFNITCDVFESRSADTEGSGDVGRRYR